MSEEYTSEGLSNPFLTNSNAIVYNQENIPRHIVAVKKKCNCCYFNFLHFNRHISVPNALFYSFMFIYFTLTYHLQ